MAIRELAFEHTHQDAAIKEAIKAELHRNDNVLKPVDSPTIFRDSTGLYSHYYVVWDRFSHLDQERRSNLIMDAIREELGDLEALHAATAMGLTELEASGMGIQV